VLRAIDIGLRFLYVLLAPAMLILLRAVLPITGMIVSAGIATVIALAGAERIQARLAGSKVLGKLFGGMTKLGAYYDEHPPKPLLYYIAYPILFPYWLFVRDARREFLLYRKLGAVTVVILVASAIVEYVRLWRPLPFGFFLTSFIVTLMFQLLITFALVMPIVTTVIMFHQHRLKKTLIVAASIALVLGGLVGVALHIKQPITASAKMRVNARVVFEKERAVTTLEHALDAYAAVVAKDPNATDAAEDAARDVLGDLFRPDEQRALKFYADSGGVMIYLKSRHGFVFLGRAANGRYITKVDDLPAAARAAMKL